MRWTERQLAMLREIGVVLPSWPDQPEGEVAAARDEERPRAASLVRDAVVAPAVTSPATTARRAPLPPPTEAAPRAASPSRVDTAAPLARADWLVVADIGSDDETALLTAMLAAIGVSESSDEPTARAARVDSRDLDLDGAIERVQPRVVLALGRIAAQALLGSDEPLGKLRGRVHERAGVRVVVTWPPSYLLRQPEEKAKAWVDLCLAAEAAGDVTPSASPSSDASSR